MSANKGAEPRTRVPAAAPARLAYLDILRGVASLLVVTYHSISRGAGPLPKEVSLDSPLMKVPYCIVRTQVDLFFVLSGFLIGGLLFRELRSRSSLDVGRFIIRRGFKIWPSYFMFLAGICLIRVFLLHEPWHHLRLLKPNLFHIQNYAGAVYAPHTWSLAVEEHFYLALPFLLVLLVWRRKAPLTSIPGLPAIALLVFVGCAVLRSLTPEIGRASCR